VKEILFSGKGGKREALKARIYILIFEHSMDKKRFS